MRKLVVAAAVLVAVSFQADAASKRVATHPAHHCYSTADMEAEQAILFQTNLMVVSSTCQDTTYAEFRLRNREAIIRYQNEMISHFRHEGARAPDKAFETYITNLANEASRKQNGAPTALICQQSAGMLKQASLLDAKGLHEYAEAQAKTASASYTKCTE